MPLAKVEVAVADVILRRVASIPQPKVEVAVVEVALKAVMVKGLVVVAER